MGVNADAFERGPKDERARRSGVAIFALGAAAALVAVAASAQRAWFGETAEEPVAQHSRQPGETFREPLRSGGTGPEMVVIPPGQFWMGCVSGVDCDSDELPVRQVTISPLAVSMYEVTFADWDACVTAGGCAHRPGDGGWGRGRRPVINVSWDDAQQYVRWLSASTAGAYRLLSESEWEYSARAGSATAYSWGNKIGSGLANCYKCGSQWDLQTVPVGSFAANAWGLHDLHGNVFEWVQDCWGATYSLGQPLDGDAWQRGDCSRRVLRGGSWFDAPWALRSATRAGLSSGVREDFIGFRVARDLPPARSVGSGLVGQSSGSQAKDVAAEVDDLKPAAGFVDRAAELGVDFTHVNGMTGELYFAEHMGSGVALSDFDGDGDLDLYLGQGHRLGPSLPGVTEGDPVSSGDRLFRNDLDAGTLGFSDVTSESGLDARGYAMGVAVGDIDNDGDPDLYVLNLGANELWRNDSEPGALRFTNITAGSNTADPRWSAAASFFDFDFDGLLDLFVGNYVEYRLVLHQQCRVEGVPDYCGPKTYRPEANRLLRNRGLGVFEDWTDRLGLSDLERPTLGVVAADFDGDGWTDVYAANDQELNALLLNRNGAAFVDEAVLAGTAVDAFGRPQASMGVLAEDFNGDGTIDLFMTHFDRETNTLYVNRGDGSWGDATSASGLGQPSYPFTGFGAAVVDYDLDGELDLYVANGAVKRIEEQHRRGDRLPLRQRNQLFRGLGEGRFEEVLNFESPTVSEVSRGLAAGDLDNDGDRDLVVANNNGPVRMLMNERQPNPQEWVGIDLRLPGKEPRHAGRRALGARVRIQDTGAGVPSRWRRFHTDGSYAAANDPRVILRLRTTRNPPEIGVYWPDGVVESFTPADLGRYFTLVRGAGEAGESVSAAVP